MSATVTTEIQCDGCGTTVDRRTDNVALYRERLASAGWTSAPIKGFASEHDFCPRCKAPTPATPSEDRPHGR